MKKIVSSVLILALLTVGCGKDEEFTPVAEDTKTEKVEANVGVVNPYFFNEDEKNNNYNNNYKVKFGYPFSGEEYETNLEINKVEATEFGDVYNITIPLDVDVPEEYKDLNYYLVTEDLIVKLNSKDVVAEITEPITLENAKEIGVIVCSETDTDYELGEGMEEVHYETNIKDGVVKFRSISDFGAGSYEEINWGKGVGLTHYEYGSDAEGASVIVDLISDEPRVLEKTTNYKGTISDIPIHMELNYYEDDFVDGSYYYDSVKQDIPLTGTRENNVLTLYSEDGNEMFEGRINSSYINGQWYHLTDQLSFNLFNETNDEWSSNNSQFIAYDDYMYYAQSNGIYALNLKTGSRDLIVDTRSPHGLTIYDNKLYYFNFDGQIYKSDLTGEFIETIEVNSDGAISGDMSSGEFYKGRIYTYWIDYIDEDNVGMYLVSTDMNGGDREIIECPELYDETLSTPLSFYELFIYDDYIYFENTITMGPEFTAYRMKLDGTDVQQLKGSPIEISGAAGGYYFTGWTGMSFAINKVAIDGNGSPEVIYKENEIPAIYNGAIVGVYNNNEYIVNWLDDKDLDYYKVKVFDFDGNLINDVKVDKPPNSDGNIFDINFGIVDEYVYFSIYGQGVVDQMGRFKTTSQGGEVEQYDTLNDAYFLN